MKEFLTNLLKGIKKQDRLFRVGDNVCWYCRPHMGKRIQIRGEIKEIKKSTFGGKVNKLGAKVHISSLNYPFNRTTTFVALDKLTKV